jgi:hypothetical protein
MALLKFFNNLGKQITTVSFNRAMQQYMDAQNIQQSKEKIS